MIYVFENYDGTASVVYEEESLNDNHKSKGIALEVLPVVEEQLGKVPVLKCKKATSEVWYDYVDKPADPIEDRVATVEDAIAELIMGGVM